MTPGETAVFIRNLAGRFAAGDFRPMLIQFRVAMAKQIARSFDAAQTADGVPWIASRKQRNPLLQRTGAMRRAAEQSIQEADIGRDYIKMKYSGPDYAMFHQTGTQKTPARPFWAVGRQTLQSLASAAAGFSATALEGR